MANLILDGRDQRFLLHELLKTEDLCGMAAWKEFSPDMFDMVLTEAERLAVEVIFPALAAGDREGCRLEGGQVYVPPSFRRCLELYRDGGWINMGVSPEAGGQGFPYVITLAAKEWFIHNFAFLCYPEPAQAAAHLIEVYGTEAQKRKYMDKMYAGVWGGTMALTEPSAGSDVGNVKTKAVRQTDGTFRLQGTKIFITSGDHDLTENIVHPVLARIEGDPAGTGGISIFLVPKYLVDDDGSLGRRNDYAIGGIEHKMGLHGSSTCVMNFGDNGDCYAELLGEERQGIKIMFQMMNEARLGTGMQGLDLGSAAYEHAVAYAKERVQSTPVWEMKNPEAKAVTIINHPDVRRKLMWMKSHVEGLRSLCYFVAYCMDMERTATVPEEKANWTGFLDLLTPIVKAYTTDKGLLICSLAMDVYGGYGYCQEYPVEQYARDTKVFSIYEGTNAIQSLDLQMRKILMNPEMYNYSQLRKRMNDAIDNAKGVVDEKYITPVVRGLAKLDEVIEMMKKQLGEGKFMALVLNATPLQQAMFPLIVAWLHLWSLAITIPKMKELLGDAKGEERQKIIAENNEAAYYSGRVLSSQFFIGSEFPKYFGMMDAILNNEGAAIKSVSENFTGAPKE